MHFSRKVSDKMERFMVLYESVYQDLYRFAYYYLGNPQDAEDVVSETVLKAYEKFSTLRNEVSFRSWIFKILVNQANDYLKKHRMNRTNELVDEPFYHPELSDALITKELLSTLSEEERRIVTLAVFGGYKGEEIAGMIGQRHSTIRSKYRRALKKLEKIVLAGEVQNES